MKKWKNYCVGLWPFLLPILLAAVVFLALLYLYQVPLDGLLYDLILVLVIGLVFLFYGFYRYSKKVRELENYKKFLPNEFLPPLHQGLLYEAEYRDILETLLKDYQRAQSIAENKQTELLDYYSMWVHQIKTPIAAMRLSLENQESRNLVLETELLKIEQYVDMALSYLRLESIHSDYRFEPIEIDRVLRDVIHKYSKLFIQKRLHLDFQKTHLKIVTDEKWLAFVLEQLLSNAIKYTFHGGVRIYAQNEILHIEDDGIGILEEDLPRIFEKGYTGYNGRQDKKATGIGLYLVKEVCRRLGIGISLTSQPNQGTCVLLDLALRPLEVE